MRQPYAMPLKPQLSQCGQMPGPGRAAVRMLPPADDRDAAWWGGLANIFYLDTRSLALMRVILGIVILLDLWVRSQSLFAHYGDAGVLPRAAALEHFLSPWNVSVHMFAGHWLLVGLLFGVHAIFAFMFTVGYRTRIATVACWFFAISLQNRNLLVLDSGDMLMRMLLFWGMFLPLGARFSIDRVFQSDRQAPPVRVISAATIALIVQMVIVYLFLAIHRDWHPRWFGEYSAGMYALHVDHFATRLAIWMRGFPTVVLVLTIMTSWLEFLGPWMVLFPQGRSRVVRRFHVVLRSGAILSLVAMHMSLSLVLELGLFSVITSAGWLALLPSGFWPMIEKRMPRARRITLYYRKGDWATAQRLVIASRLLGLRLLRIKALDDASAGAWWAVDRFGDRHTGVNAVLATMHASPWINWWLSPILAAGPMLRQLDRFYWFVTERSQAGRGMQCIDHHLRPLWTRLSGKGNAVVAAALALVIWWNIATIHLTMFPAYVPPWLQPVGQMLRLDQRWDMFSPYPMTDDGWYVIEAHQLNGQTLDLMTAEPVTWDKPELVSAMYADTRWRKYMTNLWYRDNADARLYFGKYLTRQWNNAHEGDERIERFTIYYMLEETTDDGPAKPQKVIVWSHDCFAPG